MHTQHRLRESAAFERARRRGRSWSTALLALSAVPNDLEVTRCGFVVSRRVGNAVARNRVRRRLREIVRRLMGPLPAGWDLVLSARPAAAAAAYAELEAAVRELLGRAKLTSPRLRHPRVPAGGGATTGEGLQTTSVPPVVLPLPRERET